MCGMRKLCGFILFWMAVGMAVGLYLESSFWIIVLIVIMLICGYNLFCGGN